jgi:hypothetical protein
MMALADPRYVLWLRALQARDEAAVELAESLVVLLRYAEDRRQEAWDALHIDALVAAFRQRSTLADTLLAASDAAGGAHG